MNAKQQVKELLKTVYDAGDVSAMHIWKGFSATTGETGWHFQEFGRSEHHYMGKSVAEVQQYVDEIEIEREIAAPEEYARRSQHESDLDWDRKTAEYERSIGLRD